MERIWAPWRIQYIQMEKPKGCILCEKPRESHDEQNYILYRGRNSFVIMNSFPYNPGHLMVAPYDHVASLESINDEALAEHWRIVRLCEKVIREAFNPGGFNIGINMGKAAGAGISDHIHTHVVPRWVSDTNFMQVLADVKIIPQALADTYQRLKDKFPKGGV